MLSLSSRYELHGRRLALGGKGNFELISAVRDGSALIRRMEDKTQPLSAYHVGGGRLTSSFTPATFPQHPSWLDRLTDRATCVHPAYRQHKMSEPNLSFGKNVPQPKRALPPNIGIPSHKFTYDVADQLYDEKNKVGHTRAYDAGRKTVLDGLLAALVLLWTTPIVAACQNTRSREVLKSRTVQVSLRRLHLLHSGMTCRVRSSVCGGVVAETGDQIGR